MNANRDQLYGRELVLRDEKKHCSKVTMDSEDQRVPVRIYKAVLISKYIDLGGAQH